jgi:polysaccharide export outer membrane protein
MVEKMSYYSIATRTCITCLALALAALESSCVATKATPNMIQAPPAVIQSQTQWHKEYVLAPGDQVEVVVRRFPDLTKTLTVRPDGFISLPIANDVKAEGSTIAELAEKIRTLMAEQLVKPEVSVIAVQTRQPMVYVVGDVTTESAIPFRNAPTAMQAIALAGGLKRTGAARSIAVVRLGTDGYIRAIPVTATVSGQPGPYMALRQTLLQPDDIVVVPENARSQIARALQDFVNQPLFEANLLFQPYLTFRYVQSVTH